MHACLASFKPTYMHVLNNVMYITSPVATVPSYMYTLYYS